MNIKKIAYELYKTDWTNTHTTAEEKLEVLRDYYLGLVEDEIVYSFNDYLEEFGYFGELYVCFDEFCETEYLMEEYIKELLKEQVLIKLYLKDIAE